MWNRSALKTQANISHSMLAYHCSVGVRALEAKATGHPSCRSAAPSPFFDASTWTVTGFQMSKYWSVVSLQTNFLIWLKASWYVGFHMNSESFFSSSRSGAVCVESDGMKGERYVTIPKKCWSCNLLSGGGILWIASTFFGSGWAPLASYTVPKNVTESFLTSHFSPLNTRPCWWLCTWSCVGSGHDLHHLHRWQHHQRFQ